MSLDVNNLWARRLYYEQVWILLFQRICIIGLSSASSVWRMSGVFIPWISTKIERKSTNRPPSQKLIFTMAVFRHFEFTILNFDLQIVVIIHHLDQCFNGLGILWLIPAGVRYYFDRWVYLTLRQCDPVYVDGLNYWLTNTNHNLTL